MTTKKKKVEDPVRHIRISDAVHHRLVVLAAQRRVRIGQVIAEALKTL
jgi:hypothetical protein